MSVGHYSSPPLSGLILYVDPTNTKKSWLGAPTTNLISTAISGWSSNAVTATEISTNIFQLVVTATGGSRSVAVAGAVAGGCFTVKLKAQYSTSCSVGIYTASAWAATGTGGIISGPGSISGSGTLWNVSGLTNSDWTTVYVQSSLSGTYYIYPGGTGNTTGYSVIATDPHGEALSTPSPYVNGTRSNTQALIDLTTTNTVTANSLTYASDNSFSFNGSSNYFTSTLTGFSTSAISICAFFKLTANPSSFSQILGATSTAGAIYVRSSGNIFGQLSIGGVGNVQTSDYSPSLGVWYQAVVTWTSGGTVKLYINGIFSSQSGTATGALGTFSGATAGLYSGVYLNYVLGSAQIYSRELTAAEISQNFNANRGKYGI